MSSNHHLPTSKAAQQSQRFRFLPKLRNQQQVVPTMTSEARASGENNTNNNGLPALPMKCQRQQRSPSRTDAGNHYYSSTQPMPSAPPRSARIAESQVQHSIAYTGERALPQEHSIASSPADRRAQVASYARAQHQQQQHQVYGAMSQTNGGHYGAQQRSSQAYYQQLQGCQLRGANNKNVTQSKGSGRHYSEDNDAMRAAISSSEYLGRHDEQQTLSSAYDEDEDRHYADQLRRAQMHQPMGASGEQRGPHSHNHNHKHPYSHNNHQRRHSDQNDHQSDQLNSAAAAAVALDSQQQQQQQQQQQLATGDNIQPQQTQQQLSHSPRQSLHVNFNRSSQRVGGAAIQGDEDEESTRKKKYLTAKYGQQQMNLIKKRLKIEMWLHEQLQLLAAQSKSAVEPDQLDEIDIDLDQLLDMEDDATRRHWLLKTLEPFGELPEHALQKFICDVLEQSRLL